MDGEKKEDGSGRKGAKAGRNGRKLLGKMFVKMGREE